MTIRGRIVASSLDPLRQTTRCTSATKAALRIRHRTLRSRWFEYLLVSRDAMATLVHAGGWDLTRTPDGDGPLFVGVLERRTT